MFDPKSGSPRTRQRQTAADCWVAMTPAEQKSVLIDEFNVTAQQMRGIRLEQMTNDQRRIASDYIRLVDALRKYGYEIAFSQVERVRAALGRK
ncbi:MAG: hypothetical protein CO094_11315 [Anaerolineae bacterium CG_4_9_14_3_um_filter_57_17]|nr:hypothetical protein [bacterium]NCT21651.1 hypothetical protein [bacterium]OIO86756.1 MAG: hypothetical protein AUK01_02340 [Anaerolineae bacterium CG2_30_57_67]PJB64948.1 MAG: hypothetical protein CO094_11315 [Anaerolineae bacterium CG_4_9_14_3_um_filter_57_17]